MIFQKNKKKKLIIFNLLNSFKNVNCNLNNENKNLNKVQREIFKGNKIMSNIKIFKNNNNNNNNPISIRSNNDNNKNNIDTNKELEMNPINRLNIYNYKGKIHNFLEDGSEENNKINMNNNLSHDQDNHIMTIKSILDQISIENENRIKENRLKFIESHDCNKRKKIKLKPIKINSSINNSISRSNKSIFDKKILYYHKSKLKNNNTNNEKIKDYINNQNTSYYSTLFKNTTVNIIKKDNGENEYENPYYSPSLRKNLWEEFQTIDNEEYETIEKSMMIKDGINEINNNKFKKPLYLSEKKIDINGKKKEDDITKIRSIRDIEKVLFKNRNNLIYKNINLKKIRSKLKPIGPKGLENK